MKNQKGFVILTAIISLLLFGMVIYQFSSSVRSVSKASEEVNDRFYAELMASELLEFFLSHKTNRLLTNLQTNPVNGALGSYKLCAHINLLDRAGNRMMNRDPLSEPSATAVGESNLGGLKDLNRFYMVRIINIKTLALQDNLCNTRFSALPALTGDQRFLVTVGVTWKSPNATNVKREIVSGILAEL